MVCETLDFTLTQPQATLTAGILAVVAAAIAYGGVLRNISEQRKAERRRRHVKHVLEAATEMYRSSNRLLSHDFENDVERTAILGQANIASLKLELLGFEDAARTSVQVIRRINKGVLEGNTDEVEFSDDVAQHLEAAIQSLKESVKKAQHQK